MIVARLELCGVTVAYERFTLSNVSFACEGGEILALIGRNGAGKTTTIDSVMGLTNLRSGEVRWNGQTVTRANAHRFKQSIGYVGAGQDYYPNVRVGSFMQVVSGSTAGGTRLRRHDTCPPSTSTRASGCRSSPVERGSSCPWRSPSPTARSYSCSTSPRRGWTPSSGSRCLSYWSAWPGRGMPAYCFRPTSPRTWRRSRRGAGEHRADDADGHGRLCHRQGRGGPGRDGDRPGGAGGGGRGVRAGVRGVRGAVRAAPAPQLTFQTPECMIWTARGSLLKGAVL